MRVSSASALVFILLSLLACGDQPGLRDGAGPLADADLNFLMELNAQMEDNVEARKLVFNEAAIGPAASQKALKMAELIDGACSRSGTPPRDIFDRNNTQRYTIENAGCPIYLYQERAYSLGTRELALYENWIIKQDKRNPRAIEYRKHNGIVSRVLRGKISADRFGPTTNISGTIHIQDFEVDGVGKIEGRIMTSQQYTGDRGRGSVVLSLESRAKRWTYSATITWDLGVSTPVYRVNGKVVERKLFDELFSSFKLVEIMDNSMRMR